jgi:hypothetical protein
MPIFKVEIVERSYSTITKYVYADSREQVENVDDADWGEIPNYLLDENTLESSIDEIELIDDTAYIAMLERDGEVHELPHEHGDWVRSDSCGAWICNTRGLCGAHFMYQGKDREPGPMMARCYCGWAADGGDGVAQLRAAGENVEDDY